MPRKQITPGRQGLYYLGMLISLVGLLSFGSAFFSFAVHFGDFSHFDELASTMFVRGFGGMVLLGVGQFLAHIGRSGVAGSGLVLNPERARKDVEPWSRMTGGVVKDALDEAGIDVGALRKGDSGLPLDEQLRRIHKLRVEGILSEQEFEEMKKKLLKRA